MDGKHQHAFLIKVTNPTLGLVRLQIGMSTYQGEFFWGDDQAGKNPVLENLLIETISNQHVDAFLLTSPNTTNPLKSELVELDSAEDTFVDFGKARDVPVEVSSWDAEQSMSASQPSNVADMNDKEVVFQGAKLLAKQSGSAWFELICVTAPVASEVFPAIPIALQIEVGNGSWESSLIKANTSDDGKEVDMVSFDLVLSWPQSS